MRLDIKNMDVAKTLVMNQLKKHGEDIDVETPINELMANFPYELDFRIEYRHTKEILHSLEVAGFMDRIHIGHVYEEYVTPGLLVIDFMEGDFFSKIGKTLHSESPERLEMAREAFRGLVDAIGNDLTLRPRISTEDFPVVARRRS